MKTIMTTIVATTLAIAGCKGKGEAGGAKGTAPAPLEIKALGLKADAPKGTKISDMLGDQMLRGPNLVVSLGKPSSFDAKTLDAAKTNIKDSYTGVKDINGENLADGWIVSAQAGSNYMVTAIRTIGGTTVKCSTTASSKTQQDNAIAVCKSLRK